MRARAFLPVFLFAVSLPVLASEEKTKEKKEDAIKVDLSYLEKTWGIKCKSHKITPPKPNFVDLPAGTGKDGKYREARKEQVGASPAEVKFLLEFTKDVENLKELREALKPGSPPTLSTLWFYCFDEDNVALSKSVILKVEGELTGKMGDAFRVTIIGIPEDIFKKTRKIEARPGEKDKDKDNSSFKSAGVQLRGD